MKLLNIKGCISRYFHVIVVRLGIFAMIACDIMTAGRCEISPTCTPTPCGRQPIKKNENPFLQTAACCLIESIISEQILRLEEESSEEMKIKRKEIIDFCVGKGKDFLKMYQEYVVKNGNDDVMEEGLVAVANIASYMRDAVEEAVNS